MGLSLGGALNAVQGAYHQVVPTFAGDEQTYATNAAASAKYDNPQPASTPSKAQAKPTPSYTPDTSGLDAQIAALNAQTQQLQAQLAAQPRLPYYNTSASWAQAQAAAQGVVDPVYTDKLNQYLQSESLGVSQEQQKEANNQSDIQTTLDQTLADIATNRQRTTQDQTTNLGDVATNESNYQTNEGTQFDSARSALLGNIANSGLTTSGLGRGQETQAITNRNVASGQQEQQFEGQRRDINTSANRTFEDLATGEERGTAAAATGTTRSKQAVQDYIDTANLDEQSFRTNNEADRLSALAGESTNQYKLQVSNFIAGLIGSGARPQDIALAQQIYGI